VSSEATGRPRNRALCCRCGDLRTVAHSYRGRPPEGVRGSNSAGPWCTWLLCSHCGLVTVHAVIVDVLAGRWGREGCDRERHDRRADRDRRRIERRLRALVADGVTVIREPYIEAMSVDDSVADLIEYADPRGVVLRICVTAEPSRVLHALDIAEDLLDAPSQLGLWTVDEDGQWRGLALLAAAA